ncbi:unnamed protein product [Penicillium nalgiovense]|nr:unnamed protein product [Penicillium salamii]CAG8665080.1 unnamed protein product [Penicillium salamii]CAG8889997.1 unnamed protein product [Penicillium salamii]CAG8904386.1 unnamed protein product [Penicillium nalgiovense]CAG8904426.1 unnamed protein product [Penicillium nalgiovense]
MSHAPNPFNVTGFVFTEAPTNYSIGPTYNPLPSEIGSGSSLHPSVPQSESWLTGSVSSTVTPSPRSSSSYREIRPRPAPTLPQPETKNEEKQRVRRPTKKTRRRVYGLTGTPNQPARRNETSAAKTPAMTSHDSATQSQGSRSCDYPPYNQESPPQASIEALQKALKAQVLHSLRVLRKIAMDHHALNLVPEIIEGWVAEIEGVDAKNIPIASSIAAQMSVPFERLTNLTKCITATGPMQKLTIRQQATELLKYILTYAEEYYLVQGSQVYLDIGRWIERLTKTNMRK